MHGKRSWCEKSKRSRTFEVKCLSRALEATLQRMCVYVSLFFVCNLSSSVSVLETRSSSFLKRRDLTTKLHPYKERLVILDYQITQQKNENYSVAWVVANLVGSSPSPKALSLKATNGLAVAHEM